MPKRPPRDVSDLTATEQERVFCRLHQQAAAKLIGVSSRTLRDDRAAPRLPDGFYHGPSLVKYAVAKQVPDDMLVSGNSPALERYRMARAQLTELELAEKSGRLVDGHALRAALLGPAAALLRDCGRRQRIEYDNACGDMLDETLDEIDRIAKRCVLIGDAVTNGHSR